MVKMVSNTLNSQKLIALALIGICVLAAVTQTSARYLPTRSDESRRERIKEVLRLLLDAPSVSNEDYANAFRGVEYQSSGGSPIAKREAISSFNPNEHHN